MMKKCGTKLEELTRSDNRHVDQDMQPNLYGKNLVGRILQITARTLPASPREQPRVVSVRNVLLLLRSNCHILINRKKEEISF